jgi:hypothetical protein
MVDTEQELTAPAARLREHLTAGADHVVVQLIAAGGGFDAGGLRALAGLIADLTEEITRSNLI